MFNTVLLSGRIATGLELKQTTSGTSVTSFCVAVERPYKKGEEKQTDFFNVVAWRNTADFICRYFAKGSLIGIEGRLMQITWEDSSGNKKSVVEIIANNVHFLESKKMVVETQEAQNTVPYTANGSVQFEEMTSDDDLPF